MRLGVLGGSRVNGILNTAWNKVRGVIQIQVRITSTSIVYYRIHKTGILLPNKEGFSTFTFWYLFFFLALREIKKIKIYLVFNNTEEKLFLRLQWMFYPLCSVLWNMYCNIRFKLKSGVLICSRVRLHNKLVTFLRRIFTDHNKLLQCIGGAYKVHLKPYLTTRIRFWGFGGMFDISRHFHMGFTIP